MGRILAGVLFVAACVGDSPEVTPPSSGGIDTTLGTVQRYAPRACGELSWHVTTGGAVDSAMIGRAQDLQVLSVPVAGGAISAFAFDKGTNLQPVKPAIELGSGMTSVSASRVGTFLVATSADASALHVTALATDLSASLPLAQVAPGLVAKSALQTAGSELILPIADDKGLRIATFDPAWNATDLRVATTEPAIAMTAAPMGDATVAVWATAASCNAMTMFAPTAGSLVTVPGACLAPALAIDPKGQRGALVFEGDDGVRMLEWSQTSFRGISTLLAQGARSPHAVFDGQRIWVSVVGDKGNLIVGYLDGGQLVTTALPTRPLDDQYDLVMMDGVVWVVTLEPDAYEAHRLCIEPTNG